MKLWNITCNGFNSSATYLISMLCILSLNALHAQNKKNPYEIDDACYQYMIKVNKVLNKPKAIAMCDTLQQIAKRKQDVKAECISYSLRAIHYQQTKNKLLFDEFPKYKSFIEKTAYLQYVFNIWCNVSDLHLALGQTDKGFQIVEKMRKYALKNNNQYGIQKSYQKLGNIFLNRSDYVSAIPNYEKALKILNETHDKNIYATENYLAICYEMTGRMEDAKALMMKSIEHTPEIYKPKMMIYFLGLISRNPAHFSNNEFLRVKQQIDSKKSKNNLSPTTLDTYYTAVSQYYISQNKLEKALLYSDSISKKRFRVNSKLSVFEEMHKWDSAFVYLADKNAMEKEEWNNQHLNYLATLTTSVDSSRLALENKQLLINQLQERQRVMELESQKHIWETQKRDLELSNQKNLLTTERQKAKLSESENQINKLKYEQQRQKIKDIEEQRNAENRHFYTIVIVLSILLVSSSIIIQITVKSKKRLAKEKDRALKAQADEQKQKYIAEEALVTAEKARLQAERADNLKSVFLQNMSHEIRTPLNAIVGFSEVLTTPEIAEAMEAEERNEMSRLIQVNSDLLLTLVNDILDISKLESGTYRMILSDVDANKLCADTLQSVKGREQTGVSLALRLPQTSVTLHTDKQRVQQVLINFLTNACKNTPTGSITLGYEPVSIADKPYLRFFVEDTGSGIPKDKIDFIFNRFEKLDNFKQGTGLGLNICRLICELVKGHIYVDSSYTNGARFVFEHPLTGRQLSLHSLCNGR